MISRFAFLLFPLAVFGQDTFTVVSAADFRATVAPSSLASLFGTRFSTETAQGIPDENGRLPVELAGASVLVGGEPAELLFVSPGQINFVVPPKTGTSTVDVVVNTVRPLPLTGTASVRLVAPAVFTVDGSGAGEGAILNAVTFTGPPFRVQTAENASSDKRTRLAVYVTGFRWAGNPDRELRNANVADEVTATLRTDSGLTLDLTVEYAGPAPGYPGLDQVNVVLPPEADAAGDAVLSLIADGVDALSVTVPVGALPEDGITVASVEISPAQVTGGETSTGKVVLSAPARRTSLAVTLSSSDSVAAQVPALVSVPAGEVSQTFSIRTTPVTSIRDVQVTASGGGRNASAALRIRPANAITLAAVELSASSTAPSTSITGRVVLSRAAPGEGVTVALSSVPDTVQMPESVVVPFGATTATFAITVGPDAGVVLIRADLNGDIREQRLDIRVPLNLVLSKKRVTGGTDVQGTVVIAAASTTGTVITLRSSNVVTARVPASITIPAGSTSAAFAITTESVSSNEIVTITAQSFNQTASAELELEAETFGIDKLTVEPDTLTGGSPAILSISIRTPVPVPALITMFSDNMAVARTPISLMLRRGTTSAKVNVTTRRVLTPTTVEITATFSGVSKSVKLRVQ